jgi:hypothetical protein
MPLARALVGECRERRNSRRAFALATPCPTPRATITVPAAAVKRLRTARPRGGAPKRSSFVNPALFEESTRTIRVEGLPARWPGYPAPEELAALGTDWVARGTS